MPTINPSKEGQPMAVLPAPAKDVRTASKQSNTAQSVHFAPPPLGRTAWTEDTDSTDKDLDFLPSPTTATHQTYQTLNSQPDAGSIGPLPSFANGKRNSKLNEAMWKPTDSGGLTYGNQNSMFSRATNFSAVTAMNRMKTIATAATAPIKRAQGGLNRAKTLALLDRLESQSSVEGKSRAYYLEGALLLTVPWATAFTGVGFRLARDESRDFFIVTPLLLASGFMLIMFATLLLLRYGYAEFCLLFRWRYLLLMLTGVCGGARQVLQNVAIQSINPSLFFVILKTSMFWLAVFNAIAYKKMPSAQMIVTLVAVLLTSVGYMVSDLEGSNVEVPLGPLCGAFSAAALDALADSMTEILGKHFCRDADNRQAELTRILVSDQFFKLLVYVVTLLSFNLEIIEKGVLHGYTALVPVFAVVPIVLKFPIFKCSTFIHGALVTNMASCFDMGAAYILELFLGIAPLAASNSVLMSAVASVLFMSAMHSLEVEKRVLESRKASISMIRAELDMMSAITDKSIASSM